jgi:SnoaL-like protein
VDVTHPVNEKGALTMANGAIGPFRGDPDDSDSLRIEQDAMNTVRQYYERVWNQGDLLAIDDLVAEEFVVHRNGEVRRGRAALKAQVTEAIANFLELRVHLEEIVALRDSAAASSAPASTRTTVAVSLHIWHKTIAGDWIRRETLDISIVDADLIVESAVKYGAPEPVTADEADRELAKPAIKV